MGCFEAQPRYTLRCVWSSLRYGILLGICLYLFEKRATRNCTLRQTRTGAFNENFYFKTTIIISRHMMIDGEEDRIFTIFMCFLSINCVETIRVY